MSIQQKWFEHRSPPIAKRTGLDCAILENRTLYSATALAPDLVLDGSAEFEGDPTSNGLDDWDQLSESSGLAI